jgi:hypothetical protein
VAKKETAQTQFERSIRFAEERHIADTAEGQRAPGGTIASDHEHRHEEWFGESSPTIMTG